MALLTRKGQKEFDRFIDQLIQSWAISFQPGSLPDTKIHGSAPVKAASQGEGGPS